MAALHGLVRCFRLSLSVHNPTLVFVLPPHQFLQILFNVREAEGCACLDRVCERTHVIHRPLRRNGNRSRLHLRRWSNKNQCRLTSCGERLMLSTINCHHCKRYQEVRLSDRTHLQISLIFTVSKAEAEVENPENSNHHFQCRTNCTLLDGMRMLVHSEGHQLRLNSFHINKNFPVSTRTFHTYHLPPLPPIHLHHRSPSTQHPTNCPQHHHQWNGSRLLSQLHHQILSSRTHQCANLLPLAPLFFPSTIKTHVTHTGSCLSVLCGLCPISTVWGS